jgi:hypothetical protein
MWPAQALGQYADDAKICPGEKPQHAPFDARTAYFNSVPQRADNSATLVTDCVEVANAPQEYYVDWPDTNVRETFTSSGRASAAETFSESPTLQSSSLYLGANRKEFQAGIYRDPSFREALSDAVKSWISHFHGAVSTVSTDRPESERRSELQRVDLEVRLDVDGTTANFSVTDRSEGSHAPLRVRTPEEIRRANEHAPPDLPLTKEATGVSFQIDREKAVVLHVPLILTNSDHRIVGAIPAVVVTSEWSGAPLSRYPGPLRQ